MRIEIDRIKISLYGISSQVVEAAAIDLRGELKRRLGVFLRSDMKTVDMGELKFGPIESETVLDAAALRGIIADRMAQVIRRKIGNFTENSSQTVTNQGGV